MPKTVNEIVALGAVTLHASLLYKTDPAAPNGKIHVSAVRTVQDADGVTYSRESETPDVLISDADICRDARLLFERIAARLATDAGAPVKHRADAEPIAPAAK